MVNLENFILTGIQIREQTLVAINFNTVVCAEASSSRACKGFESGFLWQ